MKFYRYQEIVYHDIGVKVEKKEFILIKETPKGYWITYTWDKKQEYKRWVSSSARKRFAYPTKEEAMIAFIARKKRQITILKGQIEIVQSALYFVEHNNL